MTKTLKFVALALTAVVILGPAATAAARHPATVDRAGIGTCGTCWHD
jgi:Spy/CpxP family protein refolding chaperone